MRKLLSSALLLLASLAAFGQVNAEQIINIGRNVMSMKDYMLAISYFNQAINAKPYLSEPFYLRAIARVNQADYFGAEQDCSEAIERGRYQPEPYRLRGFCRLVLKQDSLALIDLDKGLELEPGEQWLLFYRAIALTEGAHYQKADTAFRQIIRKFPKFDEAYTQQGRMLYLSGDTLAALTALDSAISMTKENPDNYLLRAQIFSEKSDWAAVDSNLNEAIRLEPTRADLYVNRATARYHNNNYRGTMEDLTSALDLEPENRGALYNRALLRFMVRDLGGALDDFTRVLEHDPADVHARYNRALIYLELRKWQKAIDDFTTIAQKYPKFFPIYYGIAQAQQGLGQNDKAIRTALYAEDMVRRYVTNPKANPLDKPTIDMDRTNREGTNRGEDDDDIDVMERYNQLVAADASQGVEITYDDKIKTRTQYGSGSIEPQEMFSLSVFDARTPLRPVSNYLREVEDINKNKYLSHKLYVSNTLNQPLSQARIDSLFQLQRNYNTALSSGSRRPVDWLGRAVVNASLRDYNTALADLDKAIELNPKFAAAYLARAAVRNDKVRLQDTDMPAQALWTAIAADLDEALRLNPRMSYAWFNKGLLAYQTGDYDQAVSHYSKAIEIDPDFAEAYFNRAIANIALHDRQAAITDLSRAGQLGIPAAYKLIKGL